MQPAAKPSQATIIGAIYPMVPPDPADGATIYAEKCLTCHGEKGLGDGPKSAQSSVTVGAIGTATIARLSIPAEWYTLLTEGDLERGMPPFNSLNDRQKWDVIAYVYQLSTPPEVLTLGQELYMQNCQRCHGQSGQGDGPAAAGLSVTPADFTDQELMAGISAEKMFETISNGDGDVMPAYAADLQEDERWALTAYLRSLTFSTHEIGEVPEEASSAYPVPAQTDQVTPEPVEVVQAEPEATIEVTSVITSLGTVRVEVVDASGNAMAVDTAVTLYGFDNMLNTYSQTLTTGEQGVYLFSDVEMPTGRAFIAGTKYEGGNYGSDVAVVEEGVSELTIQVLVYESTTDASVLVIDRAHVFLDFLQEDTVQVIEVFIISNPSNSAIVAAEPGGPVANFLLPEGAVDLQFQDGAMGERYLETPGGFADTTAVQPGSGQYQVVFAFNLPYDGKLDFSQTMTMDSNAVVIMLPDLGVKVKGEQITDDGTRDMQGTAYRVYSRTGVRSGSQLAFSLTGQPKSGEQLVSTTESSSGSIAIGLGVFGLALIGAGVWLFLRNRKQDAQDAQKLEEVQPLEAQPEGQDPSSLMDAIIALDDLYQAGKLPEEAYLQRRDELKVQLKQAMDIQE